MLLKKTLFIILLPVLTASAAIAQKPRNGDYVYKAAFAEWNGKPTGATVLVRIKGDSIQIIHNGGNLNGRKGEVIDEGIIMQHRKIGKWIIAHEKKDADAPEVGGCSDGPAEIDFRWKIFWLC